MFAQTTHVVAAPHEIACVGIPTTWLYVPSFISVQAFRSPRGSKFGLPITLAIGFYNSLYYRTSRDIDACQEIRLIVVLYVSATVGSEHGVWGYSVVRRSMMVVVVRAVCGMTVEWLY